MSLWLDHVKEIMRKNPNIPLKEVLKRASSSFDAKKSKTTTRVVEAAAAVRSKKTKKKINRPFLAFKGTDRPSTRRKDKGHRHHTKKKHHKRKCCPRYCVRCSK